MQDILVLGAGKIGALISGLMAESGSYRVQLADARKGAAAEVASAHGLETITAFDLDAGDAKALTKHVQKHKPAAFVSGLPFFCNEVVAKVARAENLHYFDLTEDVAVTEEVRKIAKGADHVFAPQCGLAPGFISIAANELIQHFDELKAVKLRVGALPQHPNNVLKYSLTWSTDGVINEYGNLCTRSSMAMKSTCCHWRVSSRSKSMARSTRRSTRRADSDRSERPMATVSST